jgi:hypothetical protein
VLLGVLGSRCGKATNKRLLTAADSAPHTQQPSGATMAPVAAAVSASAQPPEPTPSASASEVPIAPAGEVESARAEFWRCVAGRDWKGGARALLSLSQRDLHCFDQAGFIHAASTIAGAVDLTDQALSREVFEMLSARADSGGADVLYDIMVTRGASRGPGRKAWTLLQRDDVRGRASAATQIAVELNLSDCMKKRTLYDTALADGDERALTELQSLLAYSCDRKKKKPCCFQADNRLHSTIAALRAKLKAAPPATGDGR